MTITDVKNMSEKNRLYFLLYQEEKYRDYLYSMALYLEKNELWDEYAEKGITYEFKYLPISVKKVNDLKKSITLLGYEIPNTDKERLNEITEEQIKLGFKDWISYKYTDLTIQRLNKIKENLKMLKKDKIPTFVLDYFTTKTKNNSNLK